MIYTVTFNPSLDYIASVEHFQTGVVNRTEKEVMFPGGKGINVSIVLNNLGIESRALGFLAGFTGTEIRRRLTELGCGEEMIFLKDGYSRINVKLRSDEESEINGMGPSIPDEALSELYGQLDHLKEGDILVLAGSIPSALPDTIYSDIMERLDGKGIRIAVDATKDLLVNVLSYHPFVIKPNNHELGEIFGRKLNTRKEIVECAKKLQEKGARNVLVSMAGDGAVLVDEDGRTYESPAPKGRVVNSVGAGDSMVAGFLAGYNMSGNYKEAFQMGIAAGSASAFSEGLAEKAKVEEILSQLSF
ncbi:1-phosphofructokinase [Clostridium sp. AM58-1XD]|uniref:1-phosphofructokinase n=1 Tax=Clostridium sp. AM58-1XD TaxID=2292307 RepID=UPI000E53D3FA|nr:1-phosphofructokinase [Clostridium sp. AM58-1XD]RGZ01560.1 1-phosphofructokinase [Clostridium sp. AM58-1XD]